MPNSSEYVCGCGQVIVLKPKDMIRCPRCESRILYKRQTEGVVRCYSAR